MSKEVDDAILNALNVEVKTSFGEDMFIKQAIVIVLVEKPRAESDGPNDKRFQLMLKTPMPIQPSTAARMLSEAGIQFQRQKMAIEQSQEKP